MTSKHKTTRSTKNTFTSFPILIPMFLFAALLACEPKSDDKITATSNINPEVAPVVALSVDQTAVDLLKRGLDHLSGLDRFHVKTQQTLEDVINQQFRVDYETSADLTVSRPDKIRIERYGLEMHQLFYFNGKDFTLHNPFDKVYATEPLKGNIEDMFHMVRDTFGISASAADLIYPNAFSLLIYNVKGARVIGKEMIGDVMCDHLLFVRPNVSYQIWISESEPYLPYKYVVTDTSTSHLLSFSTLMTEWELSPTVSEGMFLYVPTEDTHRIEFIRMSEAMEKSID